MNTNIVLLLTCTTAVIAKTGNTKVFNGQAASKDQFPYQVKLLVNRLYFICGGSIIHKRWIITAAHCMNGIGLQISHIEVGNYLRFPYYNKGIYRIEKFITHKKYNYITNNDIALMRTQKEIKFNKHVDKIKIPNNDDNKYDNYWVTGSGWGRTGFISIDIPASCVLQFIVVQVVELEKCKELVNREYSHEITDKHICTSTEYDKRLCMGDSGGPIVANGTLIGIISFAFQYCTGDVDVHMRVSSYVPWIKKVLQNYSDYI